MNKKTPGVIGVIICSIVGYTDNHYQNTRFIEIRTQAGALKARYKKLDFNSEPDPKTLAEDTFELHKRIIILPNRWLGLKHKALEVRIRTLYELNMQ